MRGLWLHIGLFLCLCLSSAQAEDFSKFRVGSINSGTSADIINGKKIVIRWRARASQDLTGQATRIVNLLNTAAFQGISPADIQVITQKGISKATSTATLRLGTQTIVQVDREMAKLANATPTDLCISWAGALKAVFARPYVLLEDDEANVPVSEVRRIRIGGRPAGKLEAVSFGADVASAAITDNGKTLVLQGLTTGTTLAGVKSANGGAWLSVIVKRWAAKFVEPATISFSGPQDQIPWLKSAIWSCAMSRVRCEPGATATVRNLVVGNGRAIAQITAGGPEMFPIKQDISIRFQQSPHLIGNPTRTILSNDPEKVALPIPLARATLRQSETVHFLWHHISTSKSPLRMVVRLVNVSDKPASVFVMGNAAGPSDDEVYVGHNVMQNFMTALAKNSGCIFEIPAGMSCELSGMKFGPGQVVSGLASLKVLSGAGVLVESLAEAGVESKSPLSPASISDLKKRLTELELPGNRMIEATHVVGKGWTFVPIGKSPEDVELHPRLKGDYGVLHNIKVVFDNPTQAAARLEIAVRAGGGAARMIAEVDGQLVVSGNLSLGMEHILYRADLPAGSLNRTIHLRLIPQSGSNYPMQISARSFLK